MSTTDRRLRYVWQPAIVAVALALLGLIVYRTGLRAGFLSDAYIFVEISKTNSISSILRHYAPQAGTWYRPSTELFFWVEVWIFGENPLGYHLVALGAHITSAFLLYFVALRLSGSRLAATSAAAIFLLSIHAQEVVYDIADLHNAIGGVALIATFLAYLHERRILALVLMAITLTIDEAGLLVLGLVLVYELAFAFDRSSSPRDIMRTLTMRGGPFALLALGYFLFRLGVTRAEIYNETEPCRSAGCLKDGMLDYFNRLLVRPDRLRARIWIDRQPIALLSFAAAAGVIILLRPWQWRSWRPILFSCGWVTVSVAFFILSLYPYVADRFVYIPDMGMALLLAFIVHESYRSFLRSSIAGSVASAGAVAVLMVWLAAAVPMLRDRGDYYSDAGWQTQLMVNNVVEELPNPPRQVTLAFANIPRHYQPPIPPGNTGPFLFHNGLASAVRLEYDRRDLIIIDADRSAPDNIPPDAIVFEFRGTEVEMVREQGSRP